MVTYHITGKTQIYGGKKHNYEAQFESNLELPQIDNEFAIKWLQGSLRSSLLPTLKKRNPDAEAFVQLEYNILLDKNILDSGKIKNLH